MGKATTTMERSTKGRTVPRDENEVDSSRYAGRVAVRIRTLRKELGLTVEQLAKNVTKAGYTLAKTTLYHWENGTREPQLDALPALAKALKTTVHGLLPDK